MNSYRMLVTILFFFSIMVSKSIALTSEDNFDDPNWTNSQWMIYELDTDTTTTPVWDFIPIAGSYSGDIGYRVDTFNYSQEDDIGPTLSLFQNGQEYETNNLTVSTMIRFDPPDINPYSSAVEGGIFLAVDPKNLYAIILQVDYEPSAIEFDFGFGEIISGTSNYLIRRDLTGKMDYNIFYSLSVHIDSDGYFDFLLVNHETGEELVNIINFEPNTHRDEVSVGLLVGGKAVFNDFTLTGNPVEQSYASVIVLTKNTPNHIITTGSNEQVYGTSASNMITLQSDARAELINFPGQNSIHIQSSSDLFSVSRSGTVVTFQGSDGTMLKIPATIDIQTISFNDEESRVLQIHNNQVVLDAQVVTATAAAIFGESGLPGPCGAYVAPNVWKEFDCYNLAAIGKTTIDDPFTPSWRLIGGYWQWGQKGPDSSQWYDTNTPHFAHGPTGPGEGEANSSEISGWDQTDAPDGAWSDSHKTANDPCSEGFRVPTKTQWAGVLANNTQSTVGTWSTTWEDHTNYSAAQFFGNNLMLPAGGGYISYSGALTRRGDLGCYWGSSEIVGNSAWGLRFLSDSAYTHDYKYRRSGHSVRCVAE